MSWSFRVPSVAHTDALSYSKLQVTPHRCYSLTRSIRWLGREGGPRIRIRRLYPSRKL